MLCWSSKDGTASSQETQEIIQNLRPCVRLHIWLAQYPGKVYILQRRRYMILLRALATPTHTYPYTHTHRKGGGSGKHWRHSWTKIFSVEFWKNNYITQNQVAFCCLPRTTILFLDSMWQLNWAVTLALCGMCLNHSDTPMILPQVLAIHEPCPLTCHWKHTKYVHVYIRKSAGFKKWTKP